MKKVYEKPLIMFEDFTMSTNIAGDCEGDPVGNASKGTCAVIGTGDIYIFSGTVSQCEYTPTDMGGTNDDIWDGFCYHVPTEYTNLFNS